MSVLFSSIASVYGSPGQTNYAAANSALDGLAAFWQQQGNTAVSLNWGAWSGGGMALQDEQSVKRMERMGLGMLEPTTGLAALAGVMEGVRVRGSSISNFSHKSMPVPKTKRRAVSSGCKQGSVMSSPPLVAATVSPMDWPLFMQSRAGRSFFSQFWRFAQPATAAPGQHAATVITVELRSM
jgi:hypothetical protein